MDEHKVFRFAVKDKLLNSDVSPLNVSLPMLYDFVQEVSSFLRGSTRVSLSEISTSIVDGSLSLAVHDETGTLENAYEDYRIIKETRNLSLIDPVRASVLKDWHAASLSNNDRAYSLGLELSDSNVEQFLIDQETEFITKNEVWVEVEQYVYGRVFDMGGKSSTNVHVELPSGKTLTAATKPAVLIGDNENRLYRKELLRITAEQNLETMELRNETLISFEHYNPIVDEDQYETISSRVSSAWSSVENINQWVEELRGSDG